MRLRRLAFVIVTLTPAACGGEARGRSAAEVLDSAGVRVVVNTPSEGDDGVWTLPAEPEVEIGVLEGAPEYQLFQVSGASVLSDGRLVIANRGTHELRYYDASGRHLYSVGSQGDGPGEFQNLDLVGRFGGDSILTYDFQQRRMSVFLDSQFVRAFRLADESDMTFPFPAGVLERGDVIVRQGGVYMAGEATTGPDRPPIGLYVVDRLGAVTDSLGEFPGSEAFVLAQDRSMSVRPLMFGRGFYVSVVGDRISIGNNDAYSVRVYDADGSLLHVVREPRQPVPVGSDDVALYVDEQLGEIDNDDWRRRASRMFDEMPTPETFPAWSSVRLDRAGRLWVEEYRRPGDEQPTWRLFDRDGLFLAEVRTPPGLRILELGEDYVLGVARDELDVERVRLYRVELSRSAS